MSKGSDRAGRFVVPETPDDVAIHELGALPEHERRAQLERIRRAFRDPVVRALFDEARRVVERRQRQRGSVLRLPPSRPSQRRKRPVAVRATGKRDDAGDPDLAPPQRTPVAMQASAVDAGMTHVSTLVEAELERLRGLAGGRAA